MDDIADFEQERINLSILKTLKTMKILMIVGWCLTIIFVGFYIISIASVVIGIQYIRKQRVAYGICLMLFGSYTLGIWPFIAAVKAMDLVGIDMDNKSDDFKKSLLKGFDVAKTLLIVGVVTLIFGVGAFFIVIGCYFIAVQDFRKDKLAHGVCIIIFGLFTLGIWPLIYASHQKKQLINEIVIGENIG